MNCRSFRRQLLIDPQHLTAAHQAHAARCAPCARALRRAQAFEASLYSALLLERAAGVDRTWEPVAAAGSVAETEGPRGRDASTRGKWWYG